jgi:hypothetical protein
MTSSLWRAASLLTYGAIDCFHRPAGRRERARIIPIIEEERTKAPKRVNNFRANLLNRVVPEFHKHRSAKRPTLRRNVRSEVNWSLARYCTTSSAVDRNELGTIKPIALAVLRLMMVSNLVCGSTGSSAGCAPLRILST